MRSQDDLVVGADQVAGRRRARPQVVDPLQHDQPAHAGLRHDVAVQPRQGVRPQAIVQQAVAAESLVQDADAGTPLALLQAASEVVRPATIAVGR